MESRTASWRPLRHDEAPTPGRYFLLSGAGSVRGKTCTATSGALFLSKRFDSRDNPAERNASMRNSYAKLAVALAAMALLFGWTGLADAETITIDVKSNFFSPTDATVHTGDTVRWVFDQGVHTTTSTTGLWDSGVLS